MKKRRKLIVLGLTLVLALNCLFSNTIVLGNPEGYLKEHPEVAARFYEQCAREAQYREIERLRGEMERNKKLARELKLCKNLKSRKRELIKALFLF